MSKNKISLLIFLFFFFFNINEAFALDRYWVTGGNGSWNSSTNWAETSGGASGASAPTTSDACFFDASSGSGTTTTNVNVCSLGINFTGFTGTWAGSTALSTMAGNLTLGSGMTVTYTGAITWTGAGSYVLTSNGKTLTSSNTINGASTIVTLGDNLTLGSSNSFTLTAGTFNANDFNVTARTFQSGNSNVRTLSVGSGTWNITGNATTVWSTSPTTNLTLTTRPTLNFTYSGGTGTRGISTGTLTESLAPNINITAGTDTVNLSTHVNNINLTGFSGAFSNVARTIYGNLTLSSGVTLTAGSLATTFAATSGTQTITSNAKTMDFPITIDAVGATVQLADALTVGSTRTLTLTAGTLDANDFDVTTGLFSSSNSSTRTLDLGLGTWTLTGAGTVWDLATTTGLTFVPSTSTIKITDASSSSKTFAGGGLTYANLWLTGAGTGSFIITGSNTFSDFKMDTPPHTLFFTSGTTTTVDTFTIEGTSGNLMNIYSVTPGSTHTLVKAGGGTIISDYLTISDSTASPADTWFPGDNSLNISNNTGWDFPAVSTSGTDGSTALWVAGGTGTNTLAYSPDGITWTGLGTSIFSMYGIDIAYSGSRWVAVGTGTNTIAYSDDGINWTGLGTSIFSSGGVGIGYNGSRWVAVGGGTNSIAYSDDGINWTGLGTSIFSSSARGVAYDGSRWVAVGSGTNTIAYSDDNGLTWTGLGTSIFLTQGRGIAYDGSRWVAIGLGTNSIAYSDDGINWTGLGTSIFSGHGRGIAYNGSRWVAVGGTTNTIAYSDDGINWTGLGTSIFSSYGWGVASHPAPELYPPIALRTVEVPESTTRSGSVRKRFFTSSNLNEIPTSIVPSMNTIIPPVNVSNGVDLNRMLRIGMQGEDVRTLQKKLNEKGYIVATYGAGSPGNETSIFGPLTRAAVIKFQLANGLVGDGIVGPITKKALGM